MLVHGMIYQPSGEMVLDTFRVVIIDPSLEWDVRCMLGFVPVVADFSCRLPIAGELGTVGGSRIVVADDGTGIKDLKALRNALHDGVPLEWQNF